MDAIQAIDVAIFTLFNQDLSHPFLDQIMPVITDLHETPVFWIVIVAFFALWIRKSGRQAAWLISGALIALAITDATAFWLLKENIQRVRPSNDPAVEAVLRTDPHSGYSLPSNHAANNFCLAGFFTYFYPPAAALLVPMALVISYSRIYVGVHYPFDALGGAFWGVFWGLLIAWLLQRYILKKSSHPDPTKPSAASLTET